MIDTDKWIESARVSLDELEKEVKRLREEVEQWESLARAYAKILKSTNLPQELI